MSDHRAPAREATRRSPHRPRDIQRYNLFERIVHWSVAITFIALMLSGLALGLPAAGLAVRPVRRRVRRCGPPTRGSVSAFTVGVLVMLVMWAGPMRIDAADRSGSSG